MRKEVIEKLQKSFEDYVHKTEGVEFFLGSIFVFDVYELMSK